ncbi:MAG: hypothetical protein ISR39_13315 [Akkermansiaceae bacterium]|nr:hypothetical protein [Akkermansiaceae bacterium]
MLPPPMGHSLQIFFIHLTVLTAAPANDFDENGDEMQNAQGTGPDSYEGKLADSEKHTSKITIELKGRDLVEIRHVTPYNYSVPGLGRLQKDERISFQFDGVLLEAPEQKFPVAC